MERCGPQGLKPLFCEGFPARLKPSYKRECQEKYFPAGSTPKDFSRHSAQLIERAPAICEWFSSGIRRFLAGSGELLLPPVVPSPCCDGAIRFLKQTSLTVVHRHGWQRMVLFEARGLWLSWIVRGGIGCPGRLACSKARIGLTASVDTSPRIRASQEPGGLHHEWFRKRTDSLPETLKLLVVSNVWRRNLPPSSRRSR
jgi:hypothetical protein